MKFVKGQSKMSKISIKILKVSKECLGKFKNLEVETENENEGILSHYLWGI